MLSRLVALLAVAVLPLGVMVVAPPMAQAGDISPQVVNGRPPAAGEFAYLAAIRATARPGESYVCGGSFVSPTQVVTAAHCFYGPDGRRITNVSAAPGNGTAWPWSSSFVTASKVDIHPGYAPSSDDNDIAVITLSRPVPGVKTVTVPTATQWSDSR